MAEALGTVGNQERPKGQLVWERPRGQPVQERPMDQPIQERPMGQPEGGAVDGCADCLQIVIMYISQCRGVAT